MMQFQVGDSVTWKSQARGNVTKKTGIVVFVWDGQKRDYRAEIDPSNPCSVHRHQFPNHRRMFDGLLFMEQPAYLVEVPGGKTAKAVLKLLYLPRTKNLKPAETGL